MNNVIEYTLDEITQDIITKTGLTKEQLDTMDLGDIERHLGIEAQNPYKKGLYK